MRRIVLILGSIAAVAVIAIAVYLSQLGSAPEPVEIAPGTSSCAPRDSADADTDTTCEVPGDAGKPGEAPKE